MTVTGQSPGGHNAIDTIFEGLQNQQYIEFAGAWQLHDFDFWRVFQT
jgi:hypothetical protein